MTDIRIVGSGLRGPEGRRGVSGKLRFRTLTLPNGPEAGWFGTGVDGPAVFDGTSTVLGIVPVDDVYTLNKDIFVTDFTVNSGITVVTAGYRVYASGTLTVNGTGVIHNNGSDGADGITGGAAGAGGLAGTMLGGSAGGNGSSGAGAGAAGTNSLFYPSRSVGSGGNGGASAGHAGGAGGVGIPSSGFTYMIGSAAAALDVSGGPGGGGGGADADSSGGGGGGGDVLISAKHIVAPASAIRSRGGAGGAGFGISGGGGGAGGGGTIIIITDDMLGLAPYTDNSPGVPGAGVGTGAAGSAATRGALIGLGSNTPPRTVVVFGAGPENPGPVDPNGVFLNAFQTFFDLIGLGDCVDILEDTNTGDVTVNLDGC
jgi:hypothetical protein